MHVITGVATRVQDVDPKTLVDDPPLMSEIGSLFSRTKQIVDEKVDYFGIGDGGRRLSYLKPSQGFICHEASSIVRDCRPLSTLSTLCTLSTLSTLRPLSTLRSLSTLRPLRPLSISYR